MQRDQPADERSVERVWSIVKPEIDLVFGRMDIDWSCSFDAHIAQFGCAWFLITGNP